MGTPVARKKTVTPDEKPGARCARSRLTNGRVLLPSVDGRSPWARHFRDTRDAVLRHLGGDELASEPESMMARRIACLETELVYLEHQFATHRAAGSAPDADALDLYGRLANGQRRFLEAIGLERRAKDVTQTLRQILARDEAAR